MVATRMLSVLICISLHVATLALLALRHEQLLSAQGLQPRTMSRIHATSIKAIGILACGSALVLPYQFTHIDELSQCGLRVVCFFYGLKALELALCRSETPPRLILAGTASIAKYMWLLLAEMRYHSFDIAVEQKARPPNPEQTSPITGSVVAAICVGVVNYMLPLAELKCLFLLLLLQVAFEGLHAAVHPSCNHPLFYRPFSASSMGTFWSTHWHACAGLFLYSLGYEPGRWLAGRWLGVLNTFNLSGLWHGWAAASLVDDSHGVVLGGQVWGLFMLFGVVCLAERVVWGDKQGGFIQRVVVWTIPVVAAGQIFRTLERYTSIQWLRR